MIIESKNIKLRSVEISDAQFILGLRLNRGQFLSQTNPSLQNQINWIEAYKERESQNLEYYFVIEDFFGNSLGVVRIYQINYQEKTFTFGSFIIDEKSTYKYCALEAMTAVFKFCFFDLKLEKCFFDCRKNNDIANNFYQRYGAKIINSDDVDIYYVYQKNWFDRDYKKYLDLMFLA